MAGSGGRAGGHPGGAVWRVLRLHSCLSMVTIRQTIATIREQGPRNRARIQGIGVEEFDIVLLGAE
jgi:hypothetical protein